MKPASKQIDPELESILRDNPFRDPGLLTTWKRELSRLRVGERGPRDLDFEFVLKDDAEFLRAVHPPKRRRSGKTVCTNVLPQPMTGHPNAPVWLLLLNPGFCAKDCYDHINVSSKMRQCIVKTGEGRYSDLSFDKPGPEEAAKLEKRQKLILSNLRADKCPAPFYLLDESFKTGAERSGDGFRWWSRNLGLESGKGFFGQDADGHSPDIVGRCLFVLEAFPYHSVTFPIGMVKKWSNRQTAYFKFWKCLVEYGFAHREVVIRAQGNGRGALGKLLEFAGLNPSGKNIHFCRNVRNVSFSSGNIESPERIRKAIHNVLDHLWKTKVGL